MRPAALPLLGKIAIGLAAGLLGACQTIAPTPAARMPAPGAAAAGGVRFVREDAARLPPVADADWLAAWPAWLSSCQALAAARDPRQRAWQGVCADALQLQPQSGSQVRDFFFAHMDSYRVLAVDELSQEHDSGLMTGYYEPELEGSRKRSPEFAVPLYRVPSILPTAGRAELEISGELKGQELIWVRDPIEAFFVEVQGSGRIHLSDGSWVRVGYAASNGQAYRSIGRWLLDQGELAAGQVSMQGIREWARAHPGRVRELLDQNPRMVFFRELALGEAGTGPVGALGVALTPGVSVAIDPKFLPLGAPLLLSTLAPASGAPLVRLAIAQDTGGAIRGPLRVDWFWGQGFPAGEIAGRQHAQGTVQLLVPRGTAPGELL